MKHALQRMALIALFSVFLPLNVHAEINGNEAELLAIINSTREYNGVLYQVRQDYRDAARAYLDDPTVDCTDEQKQKAINQMFGSIQQGIDEGYLVAVGGAAVPETNPEAAGYTAAGSADSAQKAISGAGEGTPAEPSGGGNADGTGEAAASVQERTSESGDAETMQKETEPETLSPIVLALEQAMNTSQESGHATAPGSLLPEMSYPGRRMTLGAAVLTVLAALGALLSAYLGLFHHHHKKQNR